MSSMNYNTAGGLSSLLPSGTKHMAQHGGDAAVVLRNIDACLELGRMLRTSLGPQGRCKLVVNHLEQVMVTSDCASIVKELQVEHPAAKLLQQACQQQQDEYHDATNLVLSFGAELLYQTAALIGKMTWQTAPEILSGYTQSLQLVETFLESHVCDTVPSLRDEASLLKICHPVMASKQYGTVDILAPLVAQACWSVLDDNGELHADHVRTVKLLGRGVAQSSWHRGYVAQRGLETVVTSVAECKVAVFACGVEASSTEAKGTVVMKNAQDLLNYNPTEEAHLSDIIESIANTGTRLVVTGGNVSDMALHFMDRHGLLCLRIGSKWELRRLALAVGATALVRLGAPLPDELGWARSVEQTIMGGKTVTLITAADERASQLATIVLRASTTSVLNDLERAVDDGVQAIQAAGKDGRLVYGGGAMEMALSVMLQRQAEQVPGLEQYAMAAFAQALQVIPKTLAENAGWDATRVVADLQALHARVADTKETCDIGVDIERDGTSSSLDSASGGTTSMKERGVFDLLVTKRSAMRLAVDAVVTILKIDQIIMSKPAGGGGGGQK